MHTPYQSSKLLLNATNPSLSRRAVAFFWMIWLSVNYIRVAVNEMRYTCDRVDMLRSRRQQICRRFTKSKSRVSITRRQKRLHCMIPYPLHSAFISAVNQQDIITYQPSELLYLLRRSRQRRRAGHARRTAIKRATAGRLMFALG